MEIIFKRAHGRIKKPTHINSNVFILYAPTKITIKPASSHTIDIEVIVLLPDNSNGFVTSKFRGDEIHKFDARKQRLWIEISNKSFTFDIVIKRGSPLGFVVIEPEYLPQKHVTKKKK